MREAPSCVEDLQALGVRFDADRFGRLALGLEGGHSIRRIVHAGGSATGRRVVRQLSALAAADARITVFEGARARALWTERGPACGASARPAREPRPGRRPRRAPRPTATRPSDAGGSMALPRLLCETGTAVRGRARSGLRTRSGAGDRGAAALWARTTNPPGSQGVGLLLAHDRRRTSWRISSCCSSIRPPRSGCPGGKGFS